MDMEKIMNVRVIMSLIASLCLVVGIATALVFSLLYGENKERRRAEAAEKKAMDAERSRYQEGIAATRIRIALETELNRLGGGHYTIMDPRRLEDILLCRPKKIHVLLHSRKGSGRATIRIGEQGEIEGIDHNCSSPLFSKVESCSKQIQEGIELIKSSIPPLPCPSVLPSSYIDEEDIRREIEDRVKNALARGQKTVSYALTGNISNTVRDEIIRSMSEFGKTYVYGNRIRIVFRVA